MNPYIEKAKELLTAEGTELPDFLACIYDCYEKRENINEPLIRQHLQELEDRCKELPFDHSNAIGSACFALCAEYEYAAFTDGFQKGASLMLKLLQEKQ